ncbi:MAG: 16S rRNA processing protein RimM [Alphaproteobacteria bacterium]|nr:16S rRNA processing protein RimM [Alphaproteobacteria bacterium]MBQ7285007.1 16S rRNA processing protein RimM [Alphaproteobacteria bacterium]
MTIEEKICLGAIVGVHGIRGEVKVKSFTEDECNLTKYGRLLNESGDCEFDLKIVGHSKELLRVKIKGVEDRTLAETLIGTGLYIERSRLPEPEEDEFYHADLIGLEARSKDGDILGTVNALYNFGAGDLIELKMADGHFEMLPFTMKYVPTIDIKNGFIIVEMMQFAPDEQGEPIEG